MRIRVVVWWEYWSGYMAACWRALAMHPQIELRVIAKQPSLTTTFAEFDQSLLTGVESVVLSPEAAMDVEAVAPHLARWRPDVLLIAGWTNPAFVPLLSRQELAGAKLVLAMDTPRFQQAWRGPAIRLKRRALLSRVDHVFVPGESARQAACSLGFEPARIMTGLYGCDTAAMAPAGAARQQAGVWPRRFLFLGRLVPEKGLETLLDAYARYRAGSSSPWSLSVCGAGPLRGRLDGLPGVDYLGFVQPPALADVFARHGALVTPSWYEPWGVVLAEAAASGLPIIATGNCGASIELIREFYNGRTVPAQDAPALAAAMQWLELQEQELPLLGQRSAALAQPYSAEAVGRRWAEFLIGLANKK